MSAFRYQPIFESVSDYCQQMKDVGHDLIDVQYWAPFAECYSAVIYYDIRNNQFLLECTSYGRLSFGLLVSKDEDYVSNVASNWVHDHIWTA